MPHLYLGSTDLSEPLFTGIPRSGDMGCKPFKVAVLISQIGRIGVKSHHAKSDGISYWFKIYRPGW